MAILAVILQDGKDVFIKAGRPGFLMGRFGCGVELGGQECLPHKNYRERRHQYRLHDSIVA